MPTHEPFPQTAPIVRTRFVTNRNNVGFARKKAQTISFIERGFERLGLGHLAVGFPWGSYTVQFSSPLESYSWRWAGRLWFLAIFPSLFYKLLTFPFILARVYCPSFTRRFKLSKIDTCPISPYSKSLGVVVKAKECGSVRCRALNGSKGNFPYIFLDFLSSLVLYRFCPSHRWDFGFCRGPNCPRMYPKDFLYFILSGLGHNPPRLGPLDFPRADGPGP